MFLFPTILFTASQESQKEIILENKSAIKIVIPKTDNGYTFGAIYVNGIQVEKPLLKGMVFFKDTQNNRDIWLFASEVKKLNDFKYRFSGKYE